jgi:predicted nucleic acid-binding protein
MILLDTNVLSELMRPAPEPRVVGWLDSFADEDIWVSAVTEAEILLGIQLLPTGRRRDGLADLAGRMFEVDFSGRCLSFDAGAAVAYAGIVATRTRLGNPISVEDAQIAAIARAGGLALATRNVKDFSGIEGLKLIDPWIA